MHPIVNSSFISSSAQEIFRAALEAVDPYMAVEAQVPLIVSTYQSGGFDKLLLISFGKAAFLMAKAVSDNVGDLITRGIIITKYGHTGNDRLQKNIEIYESGHPIPDRNGVEATGKAIEMLKGADAKTLVISLISGGGSALLVAPKEGISLEDKQAVTDLLLKGGASIEELNTVRKHISAIKGGRLAEYAYPAQVISLILSDVIGDKLDMIASGPTSPDSTTYKMALHVVNKYELKGRLPATVMSILDAGAEGRIEETPKEGAPIFGRVENAIIGSNMKAALAAKDRAQAFGYETTILSTELRGEATNAARWLALKALDEKKSLKESGGRKVCLVSGGETTVTVRGSGKGGRNTELALAFALEIEGVQGITLLSAGTDGTDGPTDAAGAVVNGETIARGKSSGLVAGDYLSNNDSYSYFSKTGELLITGPTGTNVMDLQIILIV